PVTGMSRLDLERISRAASEQRCGRAGRVAPGICYRLWGEGAQLSLAATTAPEILEADLASLALELVRWGASDAMPLDWLDAPPAPMLQQARALLARLGALDRQARLTALGHEMSRLPVHPRLGALLLGPRDPGARPLAALRAGACSPARERWRRRCRGCRAVLRQRARGPCVWRAGTRRSARCSRSAFPTASASAARARRVAICSPTVVVLPLRIPPHSRDRHSSSRRRSMIVNARRGSI